MKRAIYGAVASIKRATASASASLGLLTGGIYDYSGSAVAVTSTWKATASGIGTKYTNPPAVTNPINVESVATIASTWGTIAVTARFLGGSPWAMFYPFTYSGGYGTALSSVTNVSGTKRWQASFSKDGSYFSATASSSGTNPEIFPFTAGVGTGTQYSAPASTIPWRAQQTAFNSLNTVVFCSGSEFSYGGCNVAAWQWSASGYGTKYANPTSFTSNSSYTNYMNSAFASDDSFVVTGFASAPSIQLWKWTNAGGFGTYYNTGAGGGGRYPISVNAANTYISTSCSGGGFYPWTGSGFGTLIAGPSGYGANAGLVFNAEDSIITAATGSLNVIQPYAWSNATGLGTAIGSPTASIGSSAYFYNQVAVS